jgi:hypothetical protein
MHSTRLLILFIAVLTFCSCKSVQEKEPQQSVFLFKDKDGLYLYDLIKQKDTVIFKASSKQIFLDEPCGFLGDTLQFGFRGEYNYPKETNTLKGNTYYKTYYSLDLKTGNNWISKKIFYEASENDTLKITTQFIAPDGKLISTNDSLTKYTRLSSTYKGITFNDNEPRFFSKSSVGDKSVYSLDGNVYLIDKTDTTLLVKFDGHFDLKFGSGYFQPRLEPKANYALVTYLPGFMNFTEQVSLKKVDIKTKDIFTFSEGSYSDLTFSKDGNFFLFKRNERQGNNDTWLSDIYIFDLTTKREFKIGEADIAQWRE